MTGRTFFWVTTLSLTFVAGCFHAPIPKTQAVAEKEYSPVLGTHYTTIEFEKGKADLSPTGKELLKKLARKAHEKNKDIDEIKILAWADQEYPDKVNKKASTSEIILASERAREIRDYLEEDLKETEDIDSFNMARRPDFLSRLLQMDDYEVKEAYELSGATGSTLSDGSVSYTKASKALVIIDYEGDEDNFK